MLPDANLRRCQIALGAGFQMFPVTYTVKPLKPLRLEKKLSESTPSHLLATPNGDPEYLMSSPYLESQGCHLIPPYYLLSCSYSESHYSFCLIFISFFFFACWSILLTPSPPTKNTSIFSIKTISIIGFFCLTSI